MADGDGVKRSAWAKKLHAFKDAAAALAQTALERWNTAMQHLGLVDSSAADAWADLEHLLDPTLASSSDVPPSSELGGGGAGVRLHARLTAEGTVDVVCICAPYERVLERVLGANE